MHEQIGTAGAKAVAWVEKKKGFLSVRSRVMKSGETGILAPKNRSVAKGTSPFLAQDLTHVTRQAHSDLAPRSSGYQDARAPMGESLTTKMVLLTSARNTPQPAGQPVQQAQVEANEQMVNRGFGNNAATGTRVSPVEVAERVYRLMRKELVIERERAARPGG